MTSVDNPKFSFRFASLNEALDGLNELNPKKASQAANIPVIIIEKQRCCIYICFS